MEVDSIAARHESLVVQFEKDRQALLDLATPAEREALGNPLKQINELSEFTANGHKYIIRTSLNVARFIQFEDVQQEVGFGIDFRSMYKNLGNAYESINSQRVADAGVIIHNMMSGVKNSLEDRPNPVLELCCLFICREGEDMGTVSAEVQRSKIADWVAADIDMDSFFTLASSFVNGFTPVYKEASLGIFPPTAPVKKVQRMVP